MIKLLSPFIPQTTDKLLKNIIINHDVFSNDVYNGNIQIDKTNYNIPFTQISEDDVKVISV